MPKPPDFKTSKGQALLLVLLSMAVVLTIVLSILSRSVTDVAVTSREEEALRAFSAAEAGIEQALVVGADIGTTQIGDASFAANVSGASSGTSEFASPVGLLSGESVLFWFVSHDPETQDLTCDVDNPCFTGSVFKICWGKEATLADDAATPAVEVSVFYATTPGDYATVQIARDAADPNSDRRSSNNFAAPDGVTCTVDNENFEFQKTIDLAALGVPAGSYGVQNGLQFAKVRIFYNTAASHQIGIGTNFPGNSLLPSQGFRIVSTGISGEANRRIEVFQGFGEPPAVFDAAVFSLGGVSK
jgi:hypothetical protein